VLTKKVSSYSSVQSSTQLKKKESLKSLFLKDKEEKILEIKKMLNYKNRITIMK